MQKTCEVPLSSLPVGTRFVQPGSKENPEWRQTGVVLYVNECRARVRLDKGRHDVEIVTDDGESRTFRATRRREVDWAPSAMVIPAGHDSLAAAEAAKRTDMTTKAKTTKKTGATRTTKAAKGTKKGSAAKASAKKLSAIDAAAQVLKDAKGSLTVKEMIEQMAAKRLWKSPGGKTPHATLYSAILREIGKKGKDARFKKTDRGKFASA